MLMPTAMTDATTTNTSTGAISESTVADSKVTADSGPKWGLCYLSVA